MRQEISCNLGDVLLDALVGPSVEAREKGIIQDSDIVKNVEVRLGSLLRALGDKPIQLLKLDEISEKNASIRKAAAEMVDIYRRSDEREEVQLMVASDLDSFTSFAPESIVALPLLDVESECPIADPVGVSCGHYW